VKFLAVAFCTGHAGKQAVILAVYVHLSVCLSIQKLDNYSP